MSPVLLPAHFNPRAPCGARPAAAGTVSVTAQFQSTRPVWGATGKHQRLAPLVAISIHAPRVGRDHPYTPASCIACRRFQSTRPVWGATAGKPLFRIVLAISIHAPRVGRDPPSGLSCVVLSNFNPRAPCGARQCLNVADLSAAAFQSTRPVWGATDFRTITLTIDAFQSTRPVWGAT